MRATRAVLLTTIVVGICMLTGCGMAGGGGGATKITLAPQTAVNPVMTQHVLVATVFDCKGCPVEGKCVEWMIPEGDLGAIVSVDGGGKHDNTYATSRTAMHDYTIPGTNVCIKKGQTWVVITSAVEGTTHLIAYAPEIPDWCSHKAFATKMWTDICAKFPPNACNRVGTDHPVVTRVGKVSDDKCPLPDITVCYKVISGPPATLTAGSETAAGDKGVSIKTTADGNAPAVLKQVKPMEGTNEVEVTVWQTMKPPCEPVMIARGMFKKQWVAPKLAITQCGPDRLCICKQGCYTITVANNADCNAEANNVIVSETLADGLSYVASEPKAEVQGQTLKWNVGTLAAGARANFAITVKADKEGTFTNKATATSSDTEMVQACVQSVVGAAKLAFSMSGCPQALVCDDYSYSLTVQNCGTCTAENVKIEGQFPANMATPKGSQQFARDMGNLAPGQSRTLVVPARAKATGEYRPTAVATADCTEPVKADACTTVLQPKLSIIETAPECRMPGQCATFTITVKNEGNGPARDAKVTAVVPEKLQYTNCTNNGKLEGNTITWCLGTLDCGKSAQLCFTAKTPCMQGDWKSTAQASAYCAEPVCAQASVNVKGIPGLLLEAVDCKDPVAIGDCTVYRITVTNQGLIDLTNVTVNTVLPDEMQFLKATGASKENLSSRNLNFDPVRCLAPGKCATWEVTVKGIKEGTARYEVSAKSDQVTTPATKVEPTTVFKMCD